MHNGSKHPSNKDKARKKPQVSGTTKSGNEQNGKTPEAQSFNCTLCDKTFRLQSAMEQHRRTKHLSTETVAEQAKVTAEVPTQAEVASTSSDKENGDATKTEVAATQRNVGEAAEKKLLRCEPCNRSFNSKSALVQHKHVKHLTQNLSLTCDICKQGSLPSQSALDAHRRMKHGPQNKGRRAAKPNYYCYMCESNPRENFSNQYALEKHQHKKHNVPMPVRPWPCESCDRSFDTDSQLEHHERCQHQVFRPQWHKFGEECARCGPMIPVCMDFPMAHEDDIVVQGFFHLNCQHDDCDESYEDSEERRQHEITVHNRCLTCTGYFSSEAKLKEHQSKSKMVEEERRTHLLQLEMVIRQKEVLAAMLIAAGVPKEEKTENITEDKVTETQPDAGKAAKNNTPRCIACDKTFRSTHGFDQHQRDKHNIVKPANNAKKEKEAVPAESTSPEILKEEETEDIPKDKVTESQQDAGGPAKNDPLHCRACNKTFGSTRGFDEHQRTKHNKKTSQKNERLVRQDFAMSCDVCGQKRFLTQDALDQHQRQKHQMYIPTNKPEEEDESGIWEDFGDFPCIGEKFDCYRQFDTASEMMRHVESGKCVAYSGEEIATAFMNDLMDYHHRKFYNRKKKCFTCPECKGSKFKDLTALLLHAEGDSCSLDTSEGDLHDALDEIPTVCMGGEYYDSDSDAFYRNGDPWENGFRGHSHFEY